MVGAGTKEGTLFISFYLAPTGPWSQGVTSVGLNLAQSIIDLYQSGETIDMKSFPNAIEALYPVDEYTQVAADLTASVGAATGQTISPLNATIADMYSGDVNFACSAELTALAIGGLQGSRKAYLYQFDITPSTDYLSKLGPTHAIEMAFVFGNFDELSKALSFQPWAAPTATEQALSKTIMDYWLNFARYLDPNDPNAKATDATNWPAAGCAADNYMLFGNNGAGEWVVR